MPRLAPRVLHLARRKHPLLPALLQATRNIEAAQNELRWLQEHVKTNASRRRVHPSIILRDLCRQRSTGLPLQYILGSEYFGPLEIACEPGVLIPRQETAASVTHLVQRLHWRPSSSNARAKLRVLDLCTGTGCMSLLFAHEFRTLHKEIALECLGVDISAQAVRLANKNAHDNGLAQTCSFKIGDVTLSSDTENKENTLVHLLSAHDRGGLGIWDVLIANPPYISARQLQTTTERSVRRFEPRIALVPPPSDPVHDAAGTGFYPHLLAAAHLVRAKVVLFEVADMEQAERVVALLVRTRLWDACEIWRDEPDAAAASQAIEIENFTVRVCGRGHGRSVVAWRGHGQDWML